MIKVSLCYSNKSGSEFASCSINDVDLPDAMLDAPSDLAEAIKIVYQRCVDAVNARLGVSAAAPAAPAPSPPAATPPAAPSTLPLDPRHVGAVPPAPPSTPPPVAPPSGDRKTYYGDRKGRGQDGLPTTGPQLGGWAKKRDALPWFEAFAAANNLPKLCSQWSDEWAQYAFAEYGKACLPPVSSTTGNGRPPF
jgi:hypothetical protein